MKPTFTGQNGQRIKNISHAKLGYHVKNDGPILVRFIKVFAEGKYGPNAIFTVDGDGSGEYSYKPLKDGEEHDISALLAMLEMLKGQWVTIETVGWVEGVPTMHLENEDGFPAKGFSGSTGDVEPPVPSQPPTQTPRSVPNPSRSAQKHILAAQMTQEVLASLSATGITMPPESIGAIYSTHFIGLNR